MKKSKYKLIKCPKCQAQYFPSEIFYPKYLFGNQINIVRDSEGTIIYYEGEDQDLVEDFTCEMCNTHFIAELIPNYDTKIDIKTDFSEDYTTKAYEDRIHLEEEGLFTTND